MANIKKSFNFRNGVQVDDDNLKVSTTGLVGIGTTVPTEALDVRGNLVVSGVSSATTAQAGVLTVTTLNPTEIIGAGVSIKSGIITASSGIVTFYGDGINLLNLPTSQWEDTIIGAGVSSIYNTGGNVGIATTAALFTLQVGNDVNSGQKGVGISSFGDIKASGIITATTFSGVLTGNVTGDLTGNTQGIHTGAVNLGDNVKAKFGDSGDLEIFHDTNNSKIKDTGTGTLDILSSGVNIKNAGDTVDIAKFDGGVGQVQLFYNNSKKFSTSGVGVTITSQLDTTNLNVSGVSTLGVSTFTSTVSFGSSISFNDNSKATFGDSGDLEILHTTASGGYSAIKDVGTGSLIIGSNILEIKNAALNETQAAFFEGQQVDLYYGNTKKFSTSGVGVTVYNQIDTTNIVASGVITATTELNSPLIGVGTDTPANDIQVRKSGNTEIQVTSDTGSAGITVGRESGTGNTNNAEFRYGFSAGSDYNTPQSLDIINYGTDNFNYYLSANNPGGVTGNYFWHKGLNNVRLMTLTNTGRLGIGITAPTDELHVIGGATVSGNIAVGNNLTVSGTVIGNVQGQLTGNVAGTLAGNTNTTVGISTLNNLSISGIATAARLRANKFAIGENPNLDLVSIFISNTDKVFVNDVGQVGIKTTIALTGVGVNGSSTNAVFNAIGVGITQFTSAAVDLRDAGAATSRYMIPPKVDNSGRSGLQNLVSGAMIYNTSINKLQVYNGSAWETVTSA